MRSDADVRWRSHQLCGISTLEKWIGRLGLNKRCSVNEQQEEHLLPDTKR